MIDFHNINCYDFEKLISNLLKKMGFEVEVTPSSGDGGVDVIANYSNPIFKGKYLVQCKHWNQQVGQPEIRDLYGTVMHDKAIKGILVTTSTFTDQALSFANDVGIECIDCKILYGLLKKYNFDANSQNFSAGKIFFEFDNFNIVKYKYLKENVSKNSLAANAYHDLFIFLLSYLTDDNIELIYCGLLDEAIKVGEEYKKRCKNKKNQCDYYYLSILYLLEGHILDAYEIIKSTYTGEAMEMKYDFVLVLHHFPQYKCFDYFYNEYRFQANLCCTDNKNDEMYKSIENGIADKFIFDEYILNNNILSYHSLSPYFNNNPQIQSDLAKLEQILK